MIDMISKRERERRNENQDEGENRWWTVKSTKTYLGDGEKLRTMREENILICFTFDISATLDGIASFSSKELVIQRGDEV